jgi:hypothetical protein
MSYNLTLHCGCIVYVACHPRTGLAHTRVLERRDARCRVRKHDVGVRLAVWELLPERPGRSEAELLDPFAEDGLATSAVLAGRRRPVSGEKPAG